MSNRLSRREFHDRIGRVALNQRPECTTTGIVRVTRGPKDLESPPRVPAGQMLRYALSYPFQVAAGLAGLTCNIKLCQAPGQDWAQGIDLILFDSLDRISARDAITLDRNHEAANPNAGGKTSVMCKLLGVVGFVPFGAKRSDGSTHPHAGTGFGLSHVVARPADDSEGVYRFVDRIGRKPYLGNRRYSYFDVFQLSFDGRNLKVVSKMEVEEKDYLPGWVINGSGMSNALPSGDDLLAGMTGVRPGRKMGSGITRWTRKAGRWQPDWFNLITPEDDSIEPSLIRDIDGSLLFSARGRRDSGPPIRIWRSRDEGQSWELVININGLLNSSPVTLNQAADGTPYISSNQYQPAVRVKGDSETVDGGVSRLEPKGGRGERSNLCLWPLNEARNGLECPLMIRDCLTEFGVPPNGTVWAADHPSAYTVLLADGRLHNVMGYRVLEWLENTHFVPPVTQTGTYIEEVISAGKPVPIWRF